MCNLSWWETKPGDQGVVYLLTTRGDRNKQICHGYDIPRLQSVAVLCVTWLKFEESLILSILMNPCACCDCRMAYTNCHQL